jgi:hypothetical protein
VRRRSLLAALAAGLAGCAGGEDPATASPTDSPTPTATDSPTPTATDSPTPTVRVEVTHPGPWRGRISYRNIREPIEGEGRATFDVPADAGTVVVVVEKTGDSSRRLAAFVVRGDEILTSDSTTEPFGRVRVEASP